MCGPLHFAPMTSRRRMIQLTALGGIGLWVWGAPRLGNLIPRDLSFTDVTGTPPFRRLASSGTTSALNAALIGLETTSAPLPDPCTHLYGGASTGIAIFTDANCPNCPAMDASVQAEASGTGWPVLHRMLPILGPSSELAARAFIASEHQKDTQAFRDALMASPGLPSPGMITGLAQDHLLDLDLLRVDMRSAATSDRLALDRGLARRLGLIGTPAVVIGRTILLGNLPRRVIRQIIALEQELEAPCG